MKNLIFTILFLLNLGLAHGANTKAYSDEELEIFKGKLHSKLENNLSSYLGKIKFSVFLRVNTKEIKPKKSSTELSSLYLLEHQTIPGETSLQNKIIDGASVKVVVYESLNDSINKELQEIVTSTMDPIKTNVKFSYLESTRLVYDQATNESKDLVSLLKSILNRHVPEVIRLIGVLIFAFVAIFGVVIFARLLKAPLNSIADSLKNFSSNLNKDKQTDKEADNKNLDSVLIDHKTTSEKFKENLVIFKNILDEKPVQISNLILKGEEEAAGVRKLLPYIYEKRYCDIIKENFHENHFTLMNESTFVFPTNLEFFTWFNKTIESLSVEVLQGRKSILTGVPEVQAGLLKKIPHPLLNSYLQENANPIAYQLMMDLLEGDERSNFLKELDVEEWKITFDVSDISEKDLMFEIEKIINYSSSSLSSQDVVLAGEIHTSLIIPSLLSVISLKRLKVQDSFLDSLASVSENSVNSIREIFWTPRNILSVPQSVLKDQMRMYDINQKAMIISSMPLDIGEFLIASAVDGKAKAIVQDTLDNKNNDFNEEKAELMGSKFIKALLTSYKNNEFKLTEHAKTLAVPQTKLAIVDDEFMDDADLNLGSADEGDENIDAA